jgi:hypothetical protein
MASFILIHLFLLQDHPGAPQPVEQSTFDCAEGRAGYRGNFFQRKLLVKTK